MKRKASDIIFKVEHQFTLYLQRCGVSRDTLPTDQYREIRRAFFGAAGQFFFLLTDDIPQLPGGTFVEALENMRDEIAAFWEKESRDHELGRTTYPAQMKCACSQCDWVGMIADLIKPEEGSEDDRCKCPKCGSYELYPPK